MNIALMITRDHRAGCFIKTRERLAFLFGDCPAGAQQAFGDGERDPMASHRANWRAQHDPARRISRDFARLTSFPMLFAKHLVCLLFSVGRDDDASTPVTHMNALTPDCMSSADRLAEIAAILALGLVRLRARQST